MNTFFVIAWGNNNKTKIIGAILGIGYSILIIVIVFNRLQHGFWPHMTSPMITRTQKQEEYHEAPAWDDWEE